MDGEADGDGNTVDEVDVECVPDGDTVDEARTEADTVGEADMLGELLELAEMLDVALELAVVLALCGEGEADALREAVTLQLADRVTDRVAGGQGMSTVGVPGRRE